MADSSTRNKPYFITFRMIRLILGLLIIAVGLWMFIRGYITQPNQGGSNLAALIVVFIGIFIAASARISKKKSSTIV